MRGALGPITRRRDGEECISRQYPEQETTKGTHNKRQPTNAGQQCYTSHKRQNPNQATVKASNQHFTLTSHRTLCHRDTRPRHWGAAPTTGTIGSHKAHIQLKAKPGALVRVLMVAAHAACLAYACELTFL